MFSLGSFGGEYVTTDLFCLMTGVGEVLGIAVGVTVALGEGEDSGVALGEGWGEGVIEGLEVGDDFG